MRRVIVLGPPGSGKSTLARRLGVRHGLPVFHLDQLFHRPGWRPAPEAEFRAEVDRIAELPAWVIDGNYKGSIASRFERADTLVYLDMPSWLTMARIVRRTAMSYGRVRFASAAGCPERFDGEFLRFAWRWNRASRAKSLALVDTFPGRAIVLSGRREQMRFDREQFAEAGQGASTPSGPSPRRGVDQLSIRHVDFIGRGLDRPVGTIHAGPGRRPDPGAAPEDAMTVDLLAATFWPEGAPFGAPHPHEAVFVPAESEDPEAADDAVRAEGFWAAVVRNLWRPSDAPARP